jgi:hypothetical protein
VNGVWSGSFSRSQRGNVNLGKKFMVDDDLHSRMMDAQTHLPYFSRAPQSWPRLHFCFLSYFPRFIFIVFYFFIIFKVPFILSPITMAATSAAPSFSRF